jgi:hypothetical protein
MTNVRLSRPSRAAREMPAIDSPVHLAVAEERPERCWLVSLILRFCR